MPNISKIQDDLIERVNDLQTDEDGGVKQNDVEEVISDAFRAGEWSYSDLSLNTKLCREELDVAITILFGENDVVQPNDVVGCIKNVL
jgi:hypothetical protein